MNDSVAVIVAHADDEVLGCGGTMARLAAEGKTVHVLILADGVSSRTYAGESAGQEEEARNRAATEANQILGSTSVTQLRLPDNRMDSLDLLDVVKPIEAFLARFKPGMVLTHHAGDVNIDHRVTQDAVLAACRPQPGYSVRRLLFFEVPSSTEWRPPGAGCMFEPNWFVDISPFLDTKLAALRAYADELRAFPHPRSIEAVEALARWRGATVGVPAGEAFILGRNIEMWKTS